MPGITVQHYPDEQIFTLQAFAEENDLTVDLIETRDGKWYAKIDAFAPAYFDAVEQRTVSRRRLSTKQLKTQSLAQTELANLLTAMNTLELADGDKLDISTTRIVAGDVDDDP